MKCRQEGVDIVNPCYFNLFKIINVIIAWVFVITKVERGNCVFDFLKLERRQPGSQSLSGSILWLPMKENSSYKSELNLYPLKPSHIISSTTHQT